MLTKRQNLIETISGGKPDRYVNQFEFMHILNCDPLSLTDSWPAYGEENVVDLWGVTRSYPENTPGPFPVDTPDRLLCPDVARWKEYIKAPKLTFSEDIWEQSLREVEEINREEEFVTLFMAPGLFERMHSFLSMENALMAFYEEPEAVKELIRYLEDWGYMAEVRRKVSDMLPELGEGVHVLNLGDKTEKVRELIEERLKKLPGNLF